MYLPKEIRPVRVAVIGCGAISGIYLENIAKRHRFAILELAAVSDIVPELAQAAAQKYGVPAMSVAEICACPDIEIAINLTPPTAHAAVIRQLLTAGKHVYTEKVITPDLAEARKLATLAEAKGCLLCAAPDTFLGAAAQTARWALDSGMIGTPTSCVAVLQRDAGLMAERFPFTARTGGGIGIDVGVYYATVLLSLLGPARRVCGMADTWKPQRTHYFTSRPNFGQPYTLECETLLAATVQFENGSVGSLHFNSASIRREAPVMTIYGTEGILLLPDPNCFGGAVKVLAKGQEEPYVLPPTHAYDGNERGLGVADMAWGLRNGRPPRACKEMAVHALELLVSAAESSRTGVFHSMETSFERPEPLPRGFLDANYGMNEPEAALAVLP